MYPFVLAKLFDDPRNARFLSIDICECGRAVDELSNIVQFPAYGREFPLASTFGLTGGNETFLFNGRIRRTTPSGTNEGGQGWGVGRDVEIREILLAFLYGPVACKGSSEHSAVGHHQICD